jgi:hypothetical protein
MMHFHDKQTHIPRIRQSSTTDIRHLIHNHTHPCESGQTPCSCSRSFCIRCLKPSHSQSHVMIQTVLTRTKYTTFPFAHNNKSNTHRAVVSSCSTMHQIKISQSAASDLHCRSQLIKNLILLLIIALFIKPTAFPLNTQTNTYHHA